MPLEVESQRLLTRRPPQVPRPSWAAYGEEVQKAPDADPIMELLRSKKTTEPGYPSVVGSGALRGVQGMAAGIGSIARWAGDLIGAPNLTAAGEFTSEYWRRSQQEGMSKPHPDLFRGSFFDNPSLKRAVGIIAEAIPSLGAAITVSAVTGTPVAGAVALGLLEGAPQYEEALAAGKSIEDATAYGTLSTAGTAILEYLPISRMLKFRGGGMAGAIRGGVEESAQEATQQVWQNLIAKLGYDDTQSLAEGLIESAIGGFGSGGIAGGTVAKLNDLADRADRAGVTDQELDAARNSVQSQLIEFSRSIEERFPGYEEQQAQSMRAINNAIRATPGKERGEVIANELLPAVQAIRQGLRQEAEGPFGMEGEDWAQGTGHVTTPYPGQERFAGPALALPPPPPGGPTVPGGPTIDMRRGAESDVYFPEGYTQGTAPAEPFTSRSGGEVEDIASGWIPPTLEVRQAPPASETPVVKAEDLRKREKKAPAKTPKPADMAKEPSPFDEAPNMSLGMVEAKKRPDGKYRLFFRGTRNEVFPGELFNSALEGRNFFKAEKAKFQSQKESAPLTTDEFLSATPEKMTAAIQMEDGSVVEGKTHGEAFDKIPVEQRNKIADADGFVDESGKFLTRQEAGEQMGVEAPDAAEVVAAAPKAPTKKTLQQAAKEEFESRSFVDYLQGKKGGIAAIHESTGLPRVESTWLLKGIREGRVPEDRLKMLLSPLAGQESPRIWQWTFPEYKELFGAMVKGKGEDAFLYQRYAKEVRSAIEGNEPVPRHVRSEFDALEKNPPSAELTGNKPAEKPPTPKAPVEAGEKKAPAKPAKKPVPGKRGKKAKSEIIALDTVAGTEYEFRVARISDPSAPQMTHRAEMRRVGGTEWESAMTGMATSKKAALRHFAERYGGRVGESVKNLKNVSEDLKPHIEKQIADEDYRQIVAERTEREQKAKAAEEHKERTRKEENERQIAKTLKTVKAKKTKITPTLSEEAKEADLGGPIDAFQIADFAYHKTIGRETVYSVTHVPSGLAGGNMLSRQEARELAYRFSLYPEKIGKKPTEKQTQELGKIYKDFKDREPIIKPETKLSARKPPPPETAEPSPLTMTPEQLKNLGITARAVVGWLKSAGLSQDVIDRIAVELKPVIKMTAQHRDIIRKARGKAFSPYSILGSTTFRNMSALVELAYGVQDIESLERTVYHEAFHVASRWVLPEVQYDALMKHYGTEEKAADAFADWMQKGPAMRPASAVRRIMAKLKRLLTIVRNGLQRKGFMRPEDIFGKIRTGQYRTGMRGVEGTWASAYAQTFYSKLMRTLESKLPNAGTPDQFRQTIDSWAKKGEFKADELKWSGLDEWLSEQKGKVTKQEVLGYLKANQVEIREVTKWDASRDALRPAAEKAAKKAGLTLNEASVGKLQRAGVDADSIRDFENWMFPAMGGWKGTKFSQWQLPGGENYRELLLTLPVNEAKWKKGFIVLNPDGIGKEWFATEAEARRIAKKRGGWAVWNASEKDNAAPSGVFTSSHWSEPNVLAHVRMNDRVDADGNRVLFLEEVQSDWHQAGRKEGYADSKKKPYRIEPTEVGLFQIVNEYDGAVTGIRRTEAEARDFAESNYIGSGGVPPAPFAKTWHELVIKRMLRYAAENGYDKVAWTTGEQQGQRYKEALVKEVSRIDWAPILGTTEQDIAIHTTNGPILHFAVDQNGRVLRSTTNKNAESFVGKSLEDIVGKDAAKEIQGKYKGELRPENMTVGAEGMKGFYDKIIPAFLNKYGKKWGAKVGESRIRTGRDFMGKGNGMWEVFSINQEGLQEKTLKVLPSRQEARDYAKTLPYSNWAIREAQDTRVSVHSIPITASMKESVLIEGQPMFSVIKKAQSEADQTAIKSSVGNIIRIEFHKGGMSGYIKERFGKGYSSKDIGLFKRTLSLPYWIGKKWPSIRRLVEKEIKAQETRSHSIFSDYNDTGLQEVQDAISKNPAHKKELTALIWKWDGKRLPKAAVPTDWHKKIVDGQDIEVNPKHYDEVRAYLEKQGVSPEVIDAFIVLRKVYDAKFVDIDRTLRVDKMDPTLIEEYRAAIGKIHNYFPHRRTGDSYVQIIDTKEDDPANRVKYREHYSTLRDRLLEIDKKAPARAREWLQEAWKAGTLTGDMGRFKIVQGEVKQLPDEVFFQVPIEGMQQLVASAARDLETSRAKYEAERLHNKEGRTKEEAMELAKKRLHADMEKALSKAVADVFKSRGWGRHAILRKGIPGHETEDIFGITFDYLAGYAGFKTKIERARHHYKVLTDIDAKVSPGEYTYASRYVKDVLANQDRVDRLVDGVRGAFFVKYLGFVVKSGIVNFTQNAVMAAPVLSMYSPRAHIKLSRAMKDVRRALSSKQAWTGKMVKYKGLPENEQRAIKEMVESGAAMDLFLRELKGSLPRSGWAKHMRKFVDKSGIFMQLAEKFNRTSTGLAAYRIAFHEGVNFDGLKTKGNHDLSVEWAKARIYDSHFVYGKMNYPELVRGGDIQKLFRSAYSFRTFTHNYVLAMSHLLRNQGWAGRKAFARSLRNVFLMGGLTAIPFFDAFSKSLMWAMGGDDEDPYTKARAVMPNDWLKDLVVYGLPGVAGADLTGSLSIEVPRSWGDLLGVPFAAWEDTVNMVESLKSGQTFRAISETPLTPIAVRNAMRGIELYRKGQRTRGGKDINLAGEVGPKKITALESYLKSLLGLQPVSVSKGYGAYRATKALQEGVSRRKTKFADRFMNAYNDDDRDGMEAVLREVAEWNEAAAKEGKYWKLIDLRQTLKRRRQVNLLQIPKLMRGRALKIAEEWR